MKKILGLVVSLTLIAGICAAVLAFINIKTKGPIAEMLVKKANDAALAVMPEGVKEVNKTKKGDVEIFEGKDASGEVIGYATKGKDAGGYGGDIVLMVGFKADKKTVVSYKALVATETPGLGTKLSTPEFYSQFEGKSAANPFKVKKDGGEIEAITSATITSRAVCAAINDAAKILER